MEHCDGSDTQTCLGQKIELHGAPAIVLGVLLFNKAQPGWPTDQLVLLQQVFVLGLSQSQPHTPSAATAHHGPAAGHPSGWGLNALPNLKLCQLRKRECIMVYVFRHG